MYKMILACKSDIKTSLTNILDFEVKDYLKENKIDFMAVSSKENTNVTHAFEKMAKHI